MDDKYSKETAAAPAIAQDEREAEVSTIGDYIDETSASYLAGWNNGWEKGRASVPAGEAQAAKLCSICNGYGRYQDGDSGTEADGYAPNIVECQCADEERLPDRRASAAAGAGKEVTDDDVRDAKRWRMAVAGHWIDKSAPDEIDAEIAAQNGDSK